MYAYYICLYHYIPLLLMSELPFACLWLTIWHTLIWLPIIACGLSLFDRCSIHGSNIDFHHGSFHLWWPHHSLSYESLMVGGLGSRLLSTSRLSGHSLLNPGYLAAYNHYYSTGSLNVWRYISLCEGVVGYMLNGAPCYHIVFILHNPFPHVITTHPLP